MSKVTISYNGLEASLDDIAAPVVVSYNGSAIASVIDNETKTLKCANKCMRGNLSSLGVTFPCAGKIMRTDFVIKVESGHKEIYLTAASTGNTWSVSDAGYYSSHGSGQYGYTRVYIETISDTKIRVKLQYKGNLTWSNASSISYSQFRLKVNGTALTFSKNTRTQTSTVWSDIGYADVDVTGWAGVVLTMDNAYYSGTTAPRVQIGGTKWMNFGRAVVYNYTL